MTRGEGYMQTVGATAEWRTPFDLFLKLDEEFHFTLDAASALDNNLCARFWTLADDALSKRWDPPDVYFVNPPYGRGLDRWLEKGYEAYDRGAVAVFLLPSRTDAAWWHDFVEPYAEVRFVRGRLKFGGARYNAPFASAIAIFDKASNG